MQVVSSFVGSFDETAFGLHRIDLDPKYFTIPVLDGRITTDCTVTLFTEHAISDEMIVEVSPNAAGKVVMKDRTQPGFRSRTVMANWLYQAIMDPLKANFGTGLVNAHWIRSPATRQLTVGLYWATPHFPERLLPMSIRGRMDDSVGQSVRADIEAAIEHIETMGFDPATGVIALGALTGTKPYSRHFAADARLNVSNGNYLTGVGVGRQIIQAVEMWRSIYDTEPLVGIIGATGATGSIASLTAVRGLARRLLLAATESSRAGLAGLADQFRRLESTISIDTLAANDSIEQVSQTADIVVHLKSSFDLLDPQIYRPKTVVIDPARPRANQSTLPTDRPDLVVGDGPTALVADGCLWNSRLHRHRSNQFLWCMASAAVHALSGIHDREYLMPPLNATQFDAKRALTISEELWAEALRHGFTLGGWEWHGQEFSLEDRFRAVKEQALRQERKGVHDSRE